MKAILSRKYRHETVVRTTISLPPLIFDAAQKVVKECGFVGLSDYVQAMIRKHASLEPKTGILINGQS